MFQKMMPIRLLIDQNKFWSSLSPFGTPRSTEVKIIEDNFMGALWVISRRLRPILGISA